VSCPLQRKRLQLTTDNGQRTTDNGPSKTYIFRIVVSRGRSAGEASAQRADFAAVLSRRSLVCGARSGWESVSSSERAGLSLRGIVRWHSYRGRGMGAGGRTVGRRCADAKRSHPDSFTASRGQFAGKQR